MAHFLNAAKVFDDLMPAIYDVMYTKDVKEDERNILFTPKNVFILKIIAELDHIFNAHYLKPADKGDLLVSTVYNIAKSFADEMLGFDTNNADKFVNSLTFDENGNLQATAKISGRSNKHTITLNYPHKQVRNQTQEDRLSQLKEELAALKEAIVKNIVENVNDQCDESTYYYCWSGLDLNLKISIAVREQRLKDIIAIYCSDRVHTVLDYADVKETRTKPCLWEGYSVKLHYNKKIQCTEEEFNKELSSSWKTINGLYMKEVNFARLNKTNPDQEKVWQQFIDCHFIPMYARSFKLCLYLQEIHLH